MKPHDYKSTEKVAVSYDKDCDACEFAVVMAFDAFRICIGQPTKKHPPAEVFRWMRAMTKERK